MQETQCWRDVLECLINITLHLAQHNMTFRGSSDKLFTGNNGNFLGLVELLAQYDDVLKEHWRRVMTNQSLTDHYCEKTIQNELICIVAGKVLENISTRLKVAKYYSAADM